MKRNLGFDVFFHQVLVVFSLGFQVFSVGFVMFLMGLVLLLLGFEAFHGVLWCVCSVDTVPRVGVFKMEVLSHITMTTIQKPPS